MTAVLLMTALLSALLVGRSQWRELRSLPSPSASAPAAAEVSIIIPARDEAENLPCLLTSVRSLASPVLEVIVVDDDSRDGTYEVALAGGAKAVTTRVPPGWTGKAWASQVGAGIADGRFLLFLDADTVLAPDAVDRLLARYAETGGLVSVQPYHEVPTAYEQLSAYFNIVSMMGGGAFGRGATTRPVAFGPCLLTGRTDYDRVGGHAAVRTNILDDVGLAAAYARLGLPVRCAVGDAAVRMRMYPRGPRQLVEGWTKNIASGAQQADRRAALATTGWLAAHFAVAAGAVSAALRLVGVGPQGGVGPGWFWLVAWVAVALQLRSMVHRIGSFRWWTWALFPLPLIGFGLLFLRSALLTHGRRSVGWRGRTVALTHERPVEDDR